MLFFFLIFAIYNSISRFPIEQQTKRSPKRIPYGMQNWEPSKATDAEVAQARETAIGQLTRYAESMAVERTAGKTKVHRLILLWRGMELAVAEEL